MTEVPSAAAAAAATGVLNQGRWFWGVGGWRASNPNDLESDPARILAFQLKGLSHKLGPRLSVLFSNKTF